jgi:hypothetical protein
MGPSRHNPCLSHYPNTRIRSFARDDVEMDEAELDILGGFGLSELSREGLDQLGMDFSRSELQDILASTIKFKSGL